MREHLVATVGQGLPKTLQQYAIGEDPAGQADHRDPGRLGAVQGRPRGGPYHRPMESGGQISGGGTGPKALDDSADHRRRIHHPAIMPNIDRDLR